MRKKCVHATKRKKGPYPNRSGWRRAFASLSPAQLLKAAARHIHPRRKRSAAR